MWEQYGPFKSNSVENQIDRNILPRAAINSTQSAHGYRFVHNFHKKMNIHHQQFVQCFRFLLICIVILYSSRIQCGLGHLYFRFDQTLWEKMIFRGKFYFKCANLQRFVSFRTIKHSCFWFQQCLPEFFVIFIWLYNNIFFIGEFVSKTVCCRHELWIYMWINSIKWMQRQYTCCNGWMISMQTDFLKISQHKITR